MAPQILEMCASAETDATADTNDGVWAEAQIRQTVGTDCVGIEFLPQE
jgi:hypothetical protein